LQLMEISASASTRFDSRVSVVDKAASIEANVQECRFRRNFMRMSKNSSRGFTPAIDFISDTNTKVWPLSEEDLVASGGLAPVLESVPAAVGLDSARQLLG